MKFDFAAPALRVAAGGLLLSTAAISAPAIAEESSIGIEEVIVTARKREESAQDVPVAITALSEELTSSTIRDLTDLNGFSPNVRIEESAQGGRSNAASITIRGISPTRADDNSFDSPIGVMIDGIYLGSLAGQVLENFDIERVEILRGPQGTLFGKNTVGGVVHVLRSRPTGELGLRLKATIGEDGQRELRGVANTPIIEDVLAAKVFMTSQEDDGFILNTTLDRKVPQKDYSNYGATLLFTPTDSFEALFTAEKFKDNYRGVIECNHKGSLNAIFFPYGFHKISTLPRAVAVVSRLIRITLPDVFNEDLWYELVSSQISIDSGPTEGAVRESGQKCCPNCFLTWRTVSNDPLEYVDNVW